MQRVVLALALLIVVGLAAVVLLNTDTEPPRAAADRLIEPQAGERIETLALVDGARRTLLRRSGESRWLLGEEPQATRAPVVEAAASALLDLEVARTIEDGAGDERFGFGPGGLSVEFTTSAGRTGTLELGDLNPLGGQRYVRLGDRVALVDAAALGPLQRDPADFVDRRLLGLSGGAVRGVSVRSGDVAFELARTLRGWSLGDDSPWRADVGTVESALGDLLELRADPAVPAPIDEAAPDGTITLATERGAVILEWWGDAGSPSLTARSRGEALPPGLGDRLATVPSRSIQRFIDPETPWRAATLLDLEPDRVSALRWSAHGSTWAYERADDGWHPAQGNEGPAEVDPEALAGWLAALEQIRSTGFAVADAEAGVEVARLVVEQADGRSDELVLLRGAKSDRVLVQGEPGLREVSAEVHDLLAEHRWEVRP